MKLYYHKTDGGAEYLMNTFIERPDGNKEGIINDETRYIVRIDGDITKDAELTIRAIEAKCAKCYRTDVGLTENDNGLLLCDNCWE
jgi:hypothetical protein